jgi:acyl-coenzyme A synthetase/AMP-(fatty) acid ligase
MRAENAEFLGANIVDCLHHFANTRAEHPAMEDGERVISYAELNQRTDEAATNIRDMGITAGAIVTIILGDSIEHLIVICGLARAGAVIFSLHPVLTEPEIRDSMAEAGSKLLVADIGGLDISGIRKIDKQDICAANGKVFGAPGASGQQPYVLVQSSGTTGKPKSFLLSHAKGLHQCRRATVVQGMTSEDRYVSLPHMCFHLCRAYFLYLLNLGATLVLAHDQSNEGLHEFVNKQRISYLKVMPSHLFALLDYAKDGEILFPHLRGIGIAGAPITNEQRLLARRILTANLIEEYGSNEAGVVSFAGPDEQDAYPDSVGRLLGGIETQIVDEDGQTLAVGEAGLIRFRGDGIAEEYVDNPEMNARHFRDGWYYPGDVARLNEEGYIFFLGRADDIINNAGVKFYPVEVEEVLLRHPAVVEVAVFAWPHEVAGQVAAAAVVVESEVTAQQLRVFCHQHLASYKVPYLIAFTKKLPKNALGKVVKKSVAAHFKARMRR